MFLHADSEDSDQTGWMSTLIKSESSLGAEVILLVRSYRRRLIYAAKTKSIQVIFFMLD